MNYKVLHARLTLYRLDLITLMNFPDVQAALGLPHVELLGVEIAGLGDDGEIHLELTMQRAAAPEAAPVIAWHPPGARSQDPPVPPATRIPSEPVQPVMEYDEVIRRLREGFEETHPELPLRDRG